MNSQCRQCGFLPNRFRGHAQPDERRWHVGTWSIVPSYNPKLGLLHWGTSVPQPSLEPLRGTTGSGVLYSNSNLAPDPAAGDLVWFYQHAQVYLPADNRLLPTFSRKPTIMLVRCWRHSMNTN